MSPSSKAMEMFTKPMECADRMVRLPNFNRNFYRPGLNADSAVSHGPEDDNHPCESSYVQLGLNESLPTQQRE